LGGPRDGYVAKLDASGGLIFGTYLGGSSYDNATGVAVDDAHSVYVVGPTTSSDFPVETPLYGSLQGIGDGYLTKLASTGGYLEFSTYFGGNGNDQLYEICIDEDGHMCIAGNTASGTFPLENPVFDTYGGGWDCFAAKISISEGLMFSTYIGGAAYEFVGGMSVDMDGHAYLVGGTQSTDFPTKNPYDDILGGNYDAFVMKLPLTGDSLLYSSYLGGGGDDYAWDISVDSAGNFYVVGETFSDDFPCENAFDADLSGSNDVFVSKLEPLGAVLTFSTYLGGRESEYLSSSAWSTAYGFYVAGTTSSDDFPLNNAFQDSLGGPSDVFLVRLSESDDYLCGDADGSGEVDIDDVVYLINFIFAGGPQPSPYESGDADCSESIDIDDVVYILGYAFLGGSEPCDPDGDGAPDC
jgi:hypothetical protein